MGRIFGRKPDKTRSIARFAARYLPDGEEVLAGVDVQTPGTWAEAMQASADAGVSAATGVYTFSVADDDKRSGWQPEAGAAGIDPTVARRLVFATLALTPERLLLLRRSKPTRRLIDMVTQWPLDQIERIEVPRQSERLTIHFTDSSLTWELPFARKFLPAVYDELPKLLAEAKASRA